MESVLASRKKSFWELQAPFRSVISHRDSFKNFHGRKESTGKLSARSGSIPRSSLVVTDTYKSKRDYPKFGSLRRSKLVNVAKLPNNNSLNYILKKEEAKKRIIENMHLLKKIAFVKSSVDHKALKRESAE